MVTSATVAGAGAVGDKEPQECPHKNTAQRITELPCVHLLSFSEIKKPKAGNSTKHYIK